MCVLHGNSVGNQEFSSFTDQSSDGQSVNTEVSMFFYSALNISEVFEDYIHVESTKKLLNIGVFLSSLIIPLFTIILISNL